MPELDLEENNPLLPPSQINDENYEGSIFGEDARFCPNSRQVFRICSNLKLLIDKIIPICFKEDEITSSNSAILSDPVIDLVYQAAGGKGDGKEGTSSYKYRGSLVFCLLKVCDWYWQQAEFELSDNELYSLRALTAQTIAAIIIEREKRDKYLFLNMLCHRYTICVNGVDATPVSALEMAVDMHSTIVIGSSGYQRCIKWLWRGWIIQSSTDPHSYVLYKGAASQSFRTHFDPARIKTPLYQNILEIFLSIIYLIIFTIVVNTHSTLTGDIDFFETVLYLFTVGYILDELIKFYHVGWNYLGFWNAFNDTMYCILTVAVCFRIASVNSHGATRIKYDEISFRVLACASPLMWSRLLLFLDAYKFVGAMIVVLKTMMKESILFFFLLFVVIVGFLQGFIGLDSSDGKNEATQRILISLVKAVIGGSSFEDMGNLVPPYASVLYYFYQFMLTVILMNILIALYSTAYAAIVENATDEYFALVAHKTLRYIRAPDQNLYVPPFNLIELLITPIGWFVSTSTWKNINYYVMLVIYSPLLAYITSDELSNARRIQYNRFKGVPDDANEIDTEWDLTDGYDEDSPGDGDDCWDRIRERNLEITEELRIQREGERQDPEFMINTHQFSEKIDKIVKPVGQASKVGVNWQIYEVIEKIDKLTNLLEVVVAENKELKKKLENKA